jgi:hypothetical protein
MRLCIHISEFNEHTDTIISGPYFTPEECNEGCTTTTTTTTTLAPDCCDWDGVALLNICTISKEIQMTRNGNTWTFNDYLDCGDSVSATFTCNPEVDVSDCVNKWSASISIPCIQNLVITGQSNPCGCDEAPVFGLSGDTSECSCCNCPEDDFSIACPVCIPCAQRDEETGPPPPGVSTVCEQCILQYGHACWTDGTFTYECYNDCVQTKCTQ